MKIFIWFLGLILILPTAFSQTQIFSGKLITESDQVADGKTFRFNYDENSNKVFAQTPATNLIINNGECKSNDFFRICINSANFSHKNMTTYAYYYEIDATIYQFASSLNVTGTSSSNTLLQNELANLTITIDNPSDIDVRNVYFTLDMSSFINKEVNGCFLEQGILSWNGSINSRNDKTCTSLIIAYSEGTHNIKGKLSYFNGFAKEEIDINPFIIEVLPKQLKIEHIIDADLEVKKPFYFNISVQNIHPSEDITAFIRIELPEHVSLLNDVSEFTRDANTLKSNPIYKPATAKNYSFYLEASAKGNNILREAFDYTIKNTRDSVENNTILVVMEPEPLIDLNTEYSGLMPKQKFVVVVKITNPSKHHELANIKATLNAPENLKIEKAIDKLMPNESYVIISNTLIAPEIMQSEPNNSQKINIELDIEYNFLSKNKLLSKTYELKYNSSFSNNTNLNEKTISQDVQAQSTPSTSANVSQEKKNEDGAVKGNETDKKFFWRSFDMTNAYLILALIIISFIAIVFVGMKIAKKGKSKLENKDELLQDLNKKE